MALGPGAAVTPGTDEVTFTASAELKAALNDYAEVYRRAYGQKEGVAELIPFMLEAFMNADPGFKRARKALDEARPSSSPQLKET